MKLKNIIPLIFVTLILSLNSCYDEKMEWGDPYTHPEGKDLPLALKEKISRYEALNAYTNFVLGVGIDFSLYTSDETYRNIVNQNFDEITPGNEMKQDALMKADGTLDFTRADALVNALKTAGLTIYGHTLVWHSQQRAGYLNSLIAPEVIPGTPGESQLDLSELLNGSFTGWSRNNAGGITIVEGAGLSNGPAIRFETTTAGNEWDTQLTSPEIPAIVGHAYEFSFWIKSDDEGQGRMSFAGMVNNYPWVGSGAYFSTSGTWTQIVYNQVWSSSENANVPFTAVANAIKIAFDMGKFPGVYYVDLNSINVIDLDAAPAEYNYVQNGEFEKGDLTNWSALNAGAGISVSADAKYAGDYGLKAISSATSTNDWDLQFAADAITLDPAGTYTFSFMIKSDVAGKGRISFPGGMNGDEYPWLNWDGTGTARDFATSSAWKLISVDVTNTTTLKLQFDLGTVPDVTYYVDDVKVVEKAAAKSSAKKSSALRSGPVTIEKTPEEKAAILEPVLQNYVTDVAAHFAGKIAAWDVVNEPMNENGTVRTGEEDLKSTGTFYWQYYLGKDYAVKAFKWAKEADNTAKLFINEYNLETGNNKLEGLINYVKYITDNGGKVDGIGTQLHMDVKYTTQEGIDNMFKKLAATGKLIKISEMDIKVGESPTADDYAAQAELYRYAIASFIQNVPEAQRYGATVWSVSDNEKEHEYWLTGDHPCLWDADYARKHAYKGFADGLAGKDVSADFPGTLDIKSN